MRVREKGGRVTIDMVKAFLREVMTLTRTYHNRILKNTMGLRTSTLKKK